MSDKARAALLTALPDGVERPPEAQARFNRLRIAKALGLGALVFGLAAGALMLPTLIETRSPEVAVERVVQQVASVVGPSASDPAPPNVRPIRTHSEAEALLFETINALREGRINQAEKTVNTLLEKYPNYQLAHLIRADVLKARTGTFTRIGEGASPSKELAGLITELEARAAKFTEPMIDGKRPEYFVQLGPQVRYALAVDVSRSRLYVLENAPMGPRRVLDMYATIGASGSGKLKEGDKRTPIGVYNVLRALDRTQLSDFYGEGAFPLDYPNVLDKREGKDGHGIWIHGVPKETFARAPRSSEGCIVVSNEDLKTLTPYIEPGSTQIAIADRISWIAAAQVSTEEHSLRKSLENWRLAWESRDLDRYIGFYAGNFFSDTVSSREQWRVERKSVTADKATVKVELNNLTIAQLPSSRDTMLVMFDQHYTSDTAQTKLRKRQYWQREGAQWKILYEGST